jgi:hypothetical protein
MESLEYAVGLFSRKKKSESTSTSDLPPTVGEFIGRKFRSSLSLQQCLDNFSSVKDECYVTTGPLQDVKWQMPDPGVPRTSQGRVPTDSPIRVVAYDLTAGGRIYLALWDKAVSYGTDGACEMWFVPPGFDTSPIPIAGRWKMRDNSLSSIGYVESGLWGAK